MAPRFLSIKNFDNYQHYKHRNPPWVKLHISLLDDPDFLSLPDASKWHYIGLILLASRHGNDIKPDSKYIGNRLGLTEPLNLNLQFLKDHVLASKASRLHTNADSESETEKSRDRVETEADRETALATQSLMVDTVVSLWNKIPGVVKPKSITGPIRKRLLACLDKQPELLWWTTYFDKIKDSAFLTGRKTDFAATLDWVLGPKNMAKILAGNYDDRAPVMKESAIMEQARAFLGRG